MKRIEIADTHQSASNYELEDGRVIRIHMKLITPKEQLASADFVEVETRGFEVDKRGAFVVDGEGMPITIAPQRARIPLANVRQGMDAVKPGWIKQSLPTDKEQLATVLEPHKAIKNLPKTGTTGDIKRVGDELFTWTDGLYEQVRKGRLADLANAAAVPKFDEAQVNDLVP